MIKKKSFYILSKCFGSIIIILLLFNCNEEIIPPPPEPPISEPPIYDSTLYTQELKGKVILENQTEHSNALVYLDSLNRGAGTDSSGNYSLQFSEEDSIYDGTFKIYYFVNEFEMDSAQYVLVGGKVKLDSLDVDSVGNLPRKELEQLLLIEGWTDKKEYRAGDLIAFTGRFTNVTNRMIHIFIYSCWQPFGFIGLYNENHSPSYIISPCDPVAADCDVYLQPNDFFEGTIVYTIRDGDYCSNFRPLPLDEFIVVADLFIEGRFRSPYDKFEWFIFNEWYKLHRGETPKLDWFPNKYKYPIITIIE
ncbi:MAG: carboxypeptidase-like regulatory domain-containing protein [Ignavibacteria bacterium]|nr:carboxypeptidase-like regulatory domain-containing protein [Ignavibacteria bacterium]